MDIMNQKVCIRKIRSFVGQQNRKNYVIFIIIMLLQYLTGLKLLDIMKTGFSLPVSVENKK